MYQVDIKDIGTFDVKHDYLHRGIRPRIVTTNKGIYKELQFNAYRKIYWNEYQLGYDAVNNEIQIKLLFEPQINRHKSNQDF